MGARETLLDRKAVATGIDLTMCSKKKSRVFEFEKVPLSKEGDGEGKDTLASAKIKTSPIKTCLGSEASTTEKVDKLLEKSSLAKARGMVGRSGRDTADGVVATEHVVSPVTVSGSTTAGENTDELDDMLDELLS